MRDQVFESWTARASFMGKGEQSYTLEVGRSVAASVFEAPGAKDALRRLMIAELEYHAFEQLGKCDRLTEVTFEVKPNGY